MADSEARLDAIRREIDAVDAELLALLSRRARETLQVAAVKDGETEPRYYRPERESTLLRRLAAANPGPFASRDIVRLFGEIVSSCRALELRLAIGCSTVAEACAAVGHFGGAVDVHSQRDAAHALHAVGSAGCDYAMIEYSRAGLASPVMAELPERGLTLCGEWYARSGERFVAVGREPVPPTGRDWTSFILPAGELTAVESWCRSSNLAMRSIPVEGAVPSTIVDVAIHVSDSRLGRLVERYTDRVLGAYPAAGDGDSAAP